MLGYITTKEQGASDRLIEKAARDIENSGLSVAGVVQINQETGTMTRAKMVLEILGTDQTVTISQNLGPHARGCRLDPDGLEKAAKLVFDSLDTPRDLLILNKFGKQERDGQGFRDALAKAVENDIPVLLGVNQALEPAFQAFAGEFAVKLPATMTGILTWAENVTGPR